MLWLPVTAALLGSALVVTTLLDAFEVVLLPRPARVRARLNRVFFRVTWNAWSRVAQRVAPGRKREDFIGVYGPLAMVLLFTSWALCLIAGFGLLQWALQRLLGHGQLQPLVRDMIVSGDAFFTLGYGDIVPRDAVARVLVILESGTGFGFIALTFGYLPVLLQHFARRDVQLIEFAERAGTPPCAASLLHWHRATRDAMQLEQWLREWEHWAGELIESHSSYPMLAFYRSQHEGHSWLASLAVVLDACSLLIVVGQERCLLQAAATFSTGQRVLDAVSRSLGVGRTLQAKSRMEPEEWARLRSEMAPSGNNLADQGSLAAQRLLYEPQLHGLSAYLGLPLPRWTADPRDRRLLDSREETIARLIGERSRGERCRSAG